MGFADFPIFFQHGLAGGNFCNPIPGCGSGVSIIINDNSTATPYPSIITTDASNPEIRILGLSHPFPDDIDIVLVAPNGVACVLMSDCGGGNALVNVDLTFNSGAVTPLPDATQIISGTYRPTNKGLETDPFPGLVTPVGGWQTNLAALSGIGQWKLYVVDDTSQDPGTIGRWSVNGVLSDLLTTQQTNPCGQNIIAP